MNVHTTAGGWKLFSDGYLARNSKSLPVEGRNEETDESMRDLSVGFKARKEGLELLARYKRSVYGNFYGFEEDLDPIPVSPKEHINSYLFSQISYKTRLNDIGVESKINVSERILEEGANISDMSTVARRFAVVGVDMQEGFYFTEKMKERNVEAETVLSFPKWRSNDIVAGIGGRDVRLPKDNYYNSVENAISSNLSTILASPGYPSFRFREAREPAYWANPTISFIQSGQSRTIGYGYVQDLISLGGDVDLILGTRLDHYSDIGAQWSKRAALVYRANETTVLKLLYGSAFRAPTFTEAYANGHINYRAGVASIKPEETDTYEAIAVYTPNFNHKFSVDFFYSDLKNVIDLEEYYSTIPGYQNYPDRKSKGIEFEYNFRTESAHDLYLNASYINTDYTTPPEEGSVSLNQSMPDISKVMLKGMYIYKPTDSLSFGTTWQYYSRTTQSKLSWITDDGTDTTVAPQHIVDETVTYRFSSSTEMRLSVKNLLDADIRQPSYYYNTAGGIRREGRNFFLSFTKRF